MGKRQFLIIHLSYFTFIWLKVNESKQYFSFYETFPVGYFCKSKFEILSLWHRFCEQSLLRLKPFNSRSKEADEWVSGHHGLSLVSRIPFIFFVFSGGAFKSRSYCPKSLKSKHLFLKFLWSVSGGPKSKMKKWNYEARERELNFRFLNLFPTRRRIRLLWRFPVSEPINAKYQTYYFKLSIKPKNGKNFSWIQNWNASILAKV